MSETILQILEYLRKKRGYDFIGNRISMLERRISKRVFSTGRSNFDEYFRFIQDNSAELDELIHNLTINVSAFFRDPLMWEYLSTKLLPYIISRKLAKHENTIRIWSAGAAAGEEPYSIAIILKELPEIEESSMNISIIGTDIDDDSMRNAKIATYSKEYISNVKLKHFEKYFVESAGLYTLTTNIRNCVKFEKFDLLDKKRYIPPISVYGNFDIVFCRNVLIYFNSEYQDRIFEKLHRALSFDSFLILGEAEIPTKNYKSKFTKFCSCCKIYQKRDNRISGRMSFSLDN